MAATFLRVAELGSFSRAAEHLGYSQAAVTVQMKQLERELGTQLFERIGRRIRLTEDGARFIPYAQELLKAARNARTFVQGARTPSGRLRIGTAESLSISVLPPVLLQFHRLCPLVETSLHTGLISELFDMVRQNHVDLLYFLDKKTDFPDWIKVFERPEPIVFAASASPPFAGRDHIPLEEVLAEPMALTERGVSYRYDLEQMLAAEKLELHPFLETGNTDIIASLLLRHRRMVSFLPQYVVQKQVRAGRLAVLRVDGPRLQMWSQLVYHKNKWITPQMQAFLELMRRTVGPDSGEA